MFANVTMGNVRERNGAFTEKCKALGKIVQFYKFKHILRRKLDAKLLYLVKCYDTTNMFLH